MFANNHYDSHVSSFQIGGFAKHWPCKEEKCTHVEYYGDLLVNMIYIRVCNHNE